MNVNLHCMVPTMIFVPHYEFCIFRLYIKLVKIKRNEENLSLHRIHPLYAPITYTHKLYPGPLKLSPSTFTHATSFSRDIYSDDHCI